MNVSKAARAEIDVGLVAFGAAVGQPLRTELDAGVGRRRTRQAKLRREFEIGNLTLPVEEFVLRELGARSNFAGDGAVRDAPLGGATRPTSERFSIEDRLRRGRRRERAGRASKQGKDAKRRQWVAGHGTEGLREAQRSRQAAVGE